MAEHYPGCPVLAPVADSFGVPLEQINFIVSEAVCLLLAILYRQYLSPTSVGPAVRHSVALVLGVLVGYFFCGFQFSHVFLQSLVSFIFIRLLPSSIMPHAVLVFSVGYLMMIHIYCTFFAPEGALYSIGVSGPLMITTEKITSLAYSVHDSCHGNSEKMSDLRRRHKIRDVPSALEYFSYIYYFQGILVGPLCFFADYKAYVDGTDILQKVDKATVQNGQNNNIINKTGSVKVPSPLAAVCAKLSISAFWMLFYFTVKPVFPELANSDPKFTRAHGLLYRFLYLNVSMLCCRAKYYVAFNLGDAVCNSAGLGFDGYDERGRSKWDRVTNVRVWGIEGATSFKTFVENWNIQTALWLRLICYDRVPRYKRFLTFFLSAMWHGVYPGYYFSFCLAAFVSEVGRKMRRCFRPYFLISTQRKMLYDVMTWMCTHTAISYTFYPFTVLTLQSAITFYNLNYWFLHILVVVLLLSLPSRPLFGASQTSSGQASGRNKSEDGQINGLEAIGRERKLQ